MKVKGDTVARTVCLMVALINQVLAVLGREALPIAESDVYQLSSLIATIVTALCAWWKNNSFTSGAILADRWRKERV